MSEKDLFENFERMRREIDELFGDMLHPAPYAPRRRVGFVPQVDVYYCGDPPKAVVKTELAGVDVSEVTLHIQGRELVIAGERRGGQESSERVYQQVEIEYGPFRRHVQLGADVRAEDATATYEDGVLRIELPLVQRSAEATEVPISSSEPADAPTGGEPQ